MQNEKYSFSAVHRSAYCNTDTELEIRLVDFLKLVPPIEKTVSELLEESVHVVIQNKSFLYSKIKGKRLM